MRRVTAHRAGPALAFVLLVLSFFPWVTIRSSPVAPQEAPIRMTGTVRVVDVEARTIELLTGVGHAVRVVRAHAAPDCRIEVGTAPSDMSSLEPGACVSVEYLMVPESEGGPARRTAVSIRVLEIEREGGAR